MKENEISSVDPCSDIEAEALPSMCEIRFDAFVKMYEMAIEPPNKLLPFKLRRELPVKPQWFKNCQKISLESIKYLDEYSLGRMIKDQFRQLEFHIKLYENNH